MVLRVTSDSAEKSLLAGYKVPGVEPKLGMCKAHGHTCLPSIASGPVNLML